MTLDELTALANNFRRVIDESDRTKWESNFGSFPRGACRAVSEMLGLFLRDNYGVDAVLVKGRNVKDFDPYESHAWLEVGGIIVDITCDQFPSAPLEAPFVGKDRVWHEQWSDDQQSEPFSDFYSNNKVEMERTWATAYSAVEKELLQRDRAR